MSTPFDRTELTKALTEQWEALSQLTDGLPEDRWRIPSALPGWTVFDILAHIVGTESMLLGEPTPEADTDLRALEHIHNGIGALNERWVRSLRPLPGAELLERFREIADRRHTALTEMSTEAWQEPSDSPIGTVPYGRFMQVRQFDCWMHELDIADALGRAVDEGGPRADVAFAELTTTIGRAVVKQAQAPDGSRITITLTGPVPRQMHIAVNGRAELVDTLDGPATVTLDLPSGLFARLRAGRTTPDAHAGEYTLTGDTELGDRLIRNLAFTI